MKRFSILSFCLVALLSTNAFAQDIILLNQDGEKVGVAGDIEKKVVIGDDSADAEKPAGDKASATIENGVVTVIGPDGEVETFNLSDAKSFTITRSNSMVVGEDGKRKNQSRGKAILIGPDGIRREIDLGKGGLDASITETTTPKTWMIGISCRPASAVLRSQLQLEDETGLVVTRVLKGGAAEKAGLKDNDILMYADQKPVGTRKQLSEIVNEAGAAGNDVSFTVLRAGEEISLDVTPTEREGMNQMMVEFGPGIRGFEFPDLNPGVDFEFRQFGPGIILDRGFGEDMDIGELHREMINDMDEKMKRIQEEMDAMRGLMNNGGLFNEDKQ